MVKAKQNEIIYMHFEVYQADGITPLTGQAGSCTSNLRKNGVSTGESVTIAEDGSTGYYYASFTPLAVSNYDLIVFTPSPDQRIIGESYETETADLDDLDGKLDIIDTNVDTIVAKLPTNYIMGSSVQSDKDDEIDAIFNKLPTNYIMGSSVQSDKDDEIDTIYGKLPADNIGDQALIDADLTTIEGKIDVVDGNVDSIVAKLPTNYMMGSSVQSDKDDEIDAIKTETDKIVRLLGLTHENVYTTLNWTNDTHTSSTVKLYDSKANAEAHGATGLIATYTLTVTYTGARAQTILMVKEP